MASSVRPTSTSPSTVPNSNAEKALTTTSHDEDRVTGTCPTTTGTRSLKRDLSSFVVICLGWNICNSWAGVSVTLAVSVPSGGMVTVLYGMLLVTFAYVCCVGTLAELASVFPTAGGQYHWTSILAPKKLARGLVSMPSLFLPDLEQGPLAVQRRVF